MVWVKLDDGFFRNRKARQAGKDGRALFLAGLCHCAATLSDGHIGTYDLPVIAAEADVKLSTATKLVEVGLWIKAGDEGWTVKDYNHWNRPADVVRKERDDGRERAARSRERKRNADGTFGEKESERPADQSSSSPLGVSSVSESSSSNLPLDEDDDWPTIVAKRRFASRSPRLEKVSNLRKWMRATVADVINEHGHEAAARLADHPDATALELANHVEPPAGYRKPSSNLHTDCPDCRGLNWREDPDDPSAVLPCDHRAMVP